jgi:hypothetical protein
MSADCARKNSSNKTGPLFLVHSTARGPSARAPERDPKSIFWCLLVIPFNTTNNYGATPKQHFGTKCTQRTVRNTQFWAAWPGELKQGMRVKARWRDTHQLCAGQVAGVEWYIEQCGGCPVCHRSGVRPLWISRRNVKFFWVGEDLRYGAHDILAPQPESHNRLPEGFLQDL